MSDRYPGSAQTAALERRFKALSIQMEAIRRELQALIARGTLTTTVAQTTAYAGVDGLSAHLAASDPHSQYATDVDLAAHVAASDPHPGYATDGDLSALTLVSLADVDPTGIVDGDVLVYDAGVFIPGTAGSGASVTISDTAPGSPSVGDMWWDSSDAEGGGRLYIYFDDGDSEQWVDASPPAVSGGGDAIDVAYDPTASGLVATDVQAALDEVASAVSDRILYAEGVVVVDHGANGSVARPSAAAVRWRGSVEPLNAIDNDEWLETSDYD
jgi:hypothetical protein